MSKIGKNTTLCEIKKSEIADNFDEITELVNDPKYICKKCARAANEKERLCKPKKLVKKQQ